MDAKRKVELESLLKRLDVIKIEMQTIKDVEEKRLEYIAGSDPYSEESEDQQDLVTWLDDAIGHFEMLLHSLVSATYC